PEQVLARVADEVSDAAVAEPGGVDAPAQCHRHARCLAAHQVGGAGELVDDADLGDLQLAPERVRGPAQVGDGPDPGAADGDVGGTPSPGTAEGVRDDDGDLDAEAVPDGITDAAGGPVGIHRQERGVAGFDVGQVDAGVG